MYCVVFSLKNWFDAKDMRATGGNDVNFAMDAPKLDSPDIANLREKGAIIYAVATASSTGMSSNNGPNKPNLYLPDGNFQDAAWGGQACNPYDTTRVPEVRAMVPAFLSPPIWRPARSANSLPPPAKAPPPGTIL